MKKTDGVAVVESARLFTPRQVAEILGMSLKVIYKWSSEGGGPRSVKIGNRLRFRQCDVQAFIDARLKDVV